MASRALPFEHGRGAAWRVTAASVRGGRHERAGCACQDAWACAALPDGVLLAAVADGSGSASHADVGARLAADAAVGTLARALVARTTRSSRASSASSTSDPIWQPKG